MWRAFPDSKLVKKSLARYFAIAQNKEKAKFLIAMKAAAEFGSDDSLEVLWKKHSRCRDEFESFESQVDMGLNLDAVPVPEKSYFDLKVKIAHKILECCHFCN